MLALATSDIHCNCYFSPSCGKYRKINEFAINYEAGCAAYKHRQDVRNLVMKFIFRISISGRLGFFPSNVMLLYRRVKVTTQNVAIGTCNIQFAAMDMEMPRRKLKFYNFYPIWKF